jgi:galactokinase
MKEIISVAPGRSCLFGDHQDYLGLPIIACAISRHIKLHAVENNENFFNISKPDINKTRKIEIDFITSNMTVIGDHLMSVLKVVRKYNCIPDRGYDVEFTGNIPINAGTSSSSAVVIAWTNFLLEAFGCNKEVTPEFVSKIAYEAEVIEQNSSGGKMDQYSIGLGNIIYLETGDDFSYERMKVRLPGLIIGESGIPKNTEGLLKELKENSWLSILKVKEADSNFDLKKAVKSDYNTYKNILPDRLQPYFYAAVSNYDITKKAYKEFKKEEIDYHKIGRLMNEHHKILKDTLKITVPKIDAMIDAALNAGAYGAKIVGSGKGGSIVVLAPEGKEKEVVEGIMKAGAKDAYQVNVDPGARILTPQKKLNLKTY